MKRGLLAACVTCLALALAQASFPAAAHATPPLGRLFLTPEERTARERARRAGAVTPRQSAPQPEGKGRLEGYVKRSAGPATLWIDGRPRLADAPDLPESRP